MDSPSTTSANQLNAATDISLNVLTLNEELKKNKPDFSKMDQQLFGIGPRIRKIFPDWMESGQRKAAHYAEKAFEEKNWDELIVQARNGMEAAKGTVFRDDTEAIAEFKKAETYALAAKKLDILAGLPPGAQTRDAADANMTLADKPPAVFSEKDIALLTQIKQQAMRATGQADGFAVTPSDGASVTPSAASATAATTRGQTVA